MQVVAPPFASVQQEDDFLSTMVQPFVPIQDREKDKALTSFPNPQDRYHVAFNKPRQFIRPVDAAYLQEQLFGTWNRMNWETKLKWTTTPSDNCVESQIARKTGHASGKPGMLGNFLVDEVNEDLGGGVQAILEPAPSVNSLKSKFY